MPKKEPIIFSRSTAIPDNKPNSRKKYSWLFALLGAITIHASIFWLGSTQNWFTIETPKPHPNKDIELTLLKTATPQAISDVPSPTGKTPAQEAMAQSHRSQSAENTMSAKNPPEKETRFFQTSAQPATSPKSTHQTVTSGADPLQQPTAHNATANHSTTNSSTQNDHTENGTTERNGVSVPAGNRQGLDSNLLNQSTQKELNKKPDILNIKDAELTKPTNNESNGTIFSKELRDKIATAKAEQKAYLKGKGQKQPTNYPITEDADGTRYVNIKGVCWRIPNEAVTGDRTQKSWAIVFDGCGIKSKTFHFELNISPSLLTNELLGPDSPFNLDPSTTKSLSQ